MFKLESIEHAYIRILKSQSYKLGIRGESEAWVLFPLGINFFSKFYNPNLHNIARSDRIGFKTKNLTDFNGVLYRYVLVHVVDILLINIQKVTSTSQDGSPCKGQGQESTCMAKPSFSSLARDSLVIQKYYDHFKNNHQQIYSTWMKVSE